MDIGGMAHYIVAQSVIFHKKYLTVIKKLSRLESFDNRVIGLAAAYVLSIAKRAAPKAITRMYERFIATS